MDNRSCFTRDFKKNNIFISVIAFQDDGFPFWHDTEDYVISSAGGRFEKANDRRKMIKPTQKQEMCLLETCPMMTSPDK
uniref:Uncharacterized protein n=1 Tax=Caenorhabditis tropicalis TaxID=1561998 RepID=A0A1I7URV0_9PELO